MGIIVPYLGMTVKSGRTPLRGLSEFDRIVAKAQKRVEEFDA
jgi:hypothetical protein